MGKDKMKKPIYKRWWVWVLAVIIVGSIATNGGDESADQPAKKEANNEVAAEDTSSNEEESTDDEKSEETSTEPEEEPAEPEVETFDSGMYEVGSDIQPGIYYNPDGGVYVDRLKGFSGQLEDIIANANPMGPWYIEVKDSDKGVTFKSSGWRLFDDTEKEKHEIKTSFGDGVHIVGIDIEPGKYKLDGSGTYWARLKGVSMELGDVIANGNPDGATIVTIAESDFAFQSSGGGTWTKQ
ncbi:hypothetical protein [Pseudalkalibacillus berkeleyi]|uniref:Lipoprotein n=1 Tax=Pseudalkalibacillus berkeleyi TaxID=1069813 RepID=A0ABS9H3L5_9BACL|nr:hypothetical protein [Pseudalkalibacillus berkeleyi]MCF6139543.1 hypothetical protein [Pseudalkalibacillus berkeleyi]